MKDRTSQHLWDKIQDLVLNIPRFIAEGKESQLFVSSVFSNTVNFCRYVFIFTVFNGLLFV